MWFKRFPLHFRNFTQSYLFLTTFGSFNTKMKVVQAMVQFPFTWNSKCSVWLMYSGVGVWFKSICSVWLMYSGVGVWFKSICSFKPIKVSDFLHWNILKWRGLTLGLGLKNFNCFFQPPHFSLSVHYLQTRVTSWQSSVLPQAVQVKHSTWEIHFRINPRDFCLSINTYFLFLSIVSCITSNILQNSSLVKWYSWFLGVKIWKLNLKKIEWI